MKINSKLFSALSILFFLSFFSLATNAQNRKEGEQIRPKERAERQTKRMTKSLSLTPDQASQIEAINLKYARKVSKIRKEQKAGGREKMKKIRRSQSEEIKSVLDDNQLVKFEKLKAERKKQMQNGQRKKGRRN